MCIRDRVLTMKKFVIEKDFFEIFPDAHIGVLICRGIDLSLIHI